MERRYKPKFCSFVVQFSGFYYHRPPFHMKLHVLSKIGQRTTEPPISWLMHAALSRPKLISLAAGFTDNASLPVAEARTALNQVLRSPKTGQPALQYGITAGNPALRKLTAAYLRKLDLGGTP